MFQIPDDIDFDDECLDSEFSPDLSKPCEDGPLANVKNIEAECSVIEPANLQVNYNYPQPSSVTSTHGIRSFVPKLSDPPAVQERRHSFVTGVRGNCLDVTQSVVKTNHSPRDKFCLKNSLGGPPAGCPSAKDGNSHQTHRGSSPNHLKGKGDGTFAGHGLQLPSSIGNQSNFRDAPEPASQYFSNLPSSHSEFLAKWNDNNFFSPEPKEELSCKLRSSSTTPLNQQRTAEAVTRIINKTVCQRRFPGPAGLLPPRQGSTTLIAPEEFLNELKSEENDPTYEESDLLSQSSGSVFESGAWSAMLDDLGAPGRSLLKTMNLASIKSIGRNLRSYKVPFLAVLVQSVDASLPDATVGFKDPTDEMRGVVHRDVWVQFSSDIAVGTVLVLRNVGIMSAGVSSRQHVINITGRNLTAIYSPKDELNIQLRQIHEFAASSSSKLLDEWEKVESEMHSLSPVSSRIKKPPLIVSPFNNNLGLRSRLRHPSSNNINSNQPRFAHQPGGNPRSQHFGSTMSNSSNPSFFNNPQSKNVSSSAQSSCNPFMPMSSRHTGGYSVCHPTPGNLNASHLSANKQPLMTQKLPTFTIKTPSSNRTHTTHPPPPNIDRCLQQPSLGHHNTGQAVPIKKPKVCQSMSPNSNNVMGKSNPFKLHDTSAVDSLLEGIDTDSLFGDF